MHFASQDSENTTPGTVRDNKRTTLEQLINEVAVEAASNEEPAQKPVLPPRLKPTSIAPEERSSERKEAYLPSSSRLKSVSSPLGYKAASQTGEKQLLPSSLNFKGTIGPQPTAAQITNIEPQAVIPAEPPRTPVVIESTATSPTPAELVDLMMQSPHENSVFENLKTFLTEYAHKPLIETESGVVAFVAQEGNDQHIRVYVGSMRDFCLMSGDNNSIEGQLTIDEVFEYDQEENQPLVIIRKTSQQLAPSIAGRKTFLVLEFNGFEEGPGTATHSVKKEWH